jgi:catalase (peroxidase I)
VAATDWWPNAVNLKILQKNPEAINPQDEGYDYREAVQTLDFDAFQRDFDALCIDSQDWWPADFGHYGPLFVRMSWHAAAPTASRTVGAAPVGACSVSPRWTAGRTTYCWIKPAGCCGR